MLKVVYRVGRACALAVAVAVLSGAGATGAWDERFETFAASTALEVYLAVRDAVDRALADEAEYEQVREAIEVLRGVLRQAFPHPEGHPGGDPVCGFLAGTGGGIARVDGGGGGIPRVDGGGLTVLPRVGDDPLEPLREEFAAIPRRPIDEGVLPGASRLVIVDRFELEAMALAIEAAASTHGEGAAGAAAVVAGETWDTYAQAISLAAGVEVRDADIVVPHGHLVLYHVLALLAGHPRYEVTFELDPLAQRDEDGVRSAALEVAVGVHVVAIDLIAVDFDDTGTLIAGMARAAALASEHDDAVVVTSWGITDCALIEAYQGSDPDRYPTLSALLLARIESDPGFQEILADVCVAFEPFIGTAIDCSSDLQVVATLAVLEFEAAAQLGWPSADWDEVADLFGLWGRVFASAGNQRLPFPMPPAAWPGVFGVEACVGSGAVPSDRAWYSNLGDFLSGERVAAPSESYVVVVGPNLTPPQGSHGRGLLGYWGSSFAAPHAALALGSHEVGTSVTKVGACDLP